MRCAPNKLNACHAESDKRFARHIIGHDKFVNRIISGVCSLMIGSVGSGFSDSLDVFFIRV